MATFWKETEISLDVNEIYENLSDREIKKLIDFFVKDGFVISKTPYENKSLSLLDKEWETAILTLNENRHRLSKEDEEIIKNISNKL
jgi:hypothetical protein